MTGAHEPTPLLLDACACINLAAVIDLGDAQRHFRRPIVMIAQAASEAMCLHDLVDGRSVRTPINPNALHLDALRPPELALYIRLARRLDDGEAATLAAAWHRGWSVATDDRVARRAGAGLDPPIDLVGSASLLRAYAEFNSLGTADLVRFLRTVERRASFVPPRDDIDFEWWHANRTVSESVRGSETNGHDVGPAPSA